MSISYRLSDIYDLQMGKTPSRDNAEYWEDGQYEWISIADMSKCDKYLSKTKEKITQKAVAESGIRVIPAETVIMSFKLSIGKVAITQKALFSNEAIMAFIDKGVVQVLPQYAYYLFSAQKWDKGVNRAVMGTTLNKATLSQYCVVIHDIQMQNEIIKRLNNLSILIQSRKQQLQKLDDLVKSQFIEMFGSMPCSSTLSDYIKELRAGKSVAGIDECDNKVLKTGAATFGFFDEKQVKNLPIDYIPNPLHLVECGDVIISRMNTPELVGTCSYVWEAPKKTYYPDRLWKTLVKGKVNPIFLWQLMQQESVRKQIKENASGTSGSMWNISKPNLLKIKVIDVSFELQNEFARFVEQIDKSKFRIKQSLEKLEMCYKALLQKYFG